MNLFQSWKMIILDSFNFMFLSWNPGASTLQSSCMQLRYDKFPWLKQVRYIFEHDIGIIFLKIYIFLFQQPEPVLAQLKEFGPQPKAGRADYDASKNKHSTEIQINVMLCKVNKYQIGQPCSLQQVPPPESAQGNPNRPHGSPNLKAMSIEQT